MRATVSDGDVQIRSGQIGRRSVAVPLMLSLCGLVLATSRSEANEPRPKLRNLNNAVWTRNPDQPAKAPIRLVEQRKIILKADAGSKTVSADGKVTRVRLKAQPVQHYSRYPHGYYGVHSRYPQGYQYYQYGPSSRTGTYSPYAGYHYSGSGLSGSSLLTGENYGSSYLRERGFGATAVPSENQAATGVTIGAPLYGGIGYSPYAWGGYGNVYGWNVYGWPGLTAGWSNWPGYGWPGYGYAGYGWSGYGSVALPSAAAGAVWSGQPVYLPPYGVTGGSVYAPGGAPGIGWYGLRNEYAPPLGIGTVIIQQGP